MGEPTEARCRLYTALDSCRRHKQQGRDAACCSIAAFYRMRFQSSLGNLDYAKRDSHSDLQAQQVIGFFYIYTDSEWRRPLPAAPP